MRVGYEKKDGDAMKRKREFAGREKTYMHIVNTGHDSDFLEWRK